MMKMTEIQKQLKQAPKNNVDIADGVYAYNTHSANQPGEDIQLVVDGVGFRSFYKFEKFQNTDFTGSAKECYKIAEAFELIDQLIEYDNLTQDENV